MTDKQYAEVSQATIDHLKEQGYLSLQFVLLDQGNPNEAFVEIIPSKDQGFDLDKISLSSREIEDLFDWESPMSRYVIDGNYLDS